MNTHLYAIARLFDAAAEHCPDVTRDVLTEAVRPHIDAASAEVKRLTDQIAARADRDAATDIAAASADIAAPAEPLAILADATPNDLAAAGFTAKQARAITDRAKAYIDGQKPATAAEKDSRE